MRIPGRRIGRAIAAIAAVGLILLSTVASHGCRVQGSSPAADPGAVVVFEDARDSRRS